MNEQCSDSVQRYKAGLDTMLYTRYIVSSVGEPLYKAHLVLFTRAEMFEVLAQSKT
jgi:hypothetical protein